MTNEQYNNQQRDAWKQIAALLRKVADAGRSVKDEAMTARIGAKDQERRSEVDTYDDDMVVNAVQEAIESLRCSIDEMTEMLQEVEGLTEEISDRVDAFDGDSDEDREAEGL